MVLDKVNNMSNNKQRPIGVFDSGVGGLTNVRALMERLPMENIVYFGDTARVPYGVKSRATIETFTAQIVEFLLQNDVKALVIACNTIAAVAGQKVRAMAGNMPVLDVITAGAEAALADIRYPALRLSPRINNVSAAAARKVNRTRNRKGQCQRKTLLKFIILRNPSVRVIMSYPSLPELNWLSNAPRPLR